MFVRFIRVLLCFMLLAGGLSGCQSPEKKKEAEKKKAEEKKPKIPDMNGDMSFQSFLGRLRLAVAKHDQATLTMMMTSDFGYRWDPAMPGESPFNYWDQHNLWGELEHVLDQHFVPNGLYMVAPPEFVNSTIFTGYRVGLRLDNGGWRFAYFINGQDPLP
jgi:hypothetical protein